MDKTAGGDGTTEPGRAQDQLSVKQEKAWTPEGAPRVS